MSVCQIVIVGALTSIPAKMAVAAEVPKIRNWIAAASIDRRILGVRLEEEFNATFSVVADGGRTGYACKG